MSQDKALVFQALLEQTIDVDEFVQFEAIEGINSLLKGKGVLHLSIEKNNLSLFKKLIRYPDIDVNLRDEYGATPLRYILRRNRHKMFSELLEISELDLKLDTIATEEYCHTEQPVALDLGRRGNRKMLEIWDQWKGSDAWDVFGQLDEQTIRRWSLNSRNEDTFSALDTALLEPNPEALKWLTKKTSLKPNQTALQRPLRGLFFYENAGHLPHPGQLLTDAMGEPEDKIFWKALSKDTTQNGIDVALALLHYLERKRLESTLPDAQGATKNRKKISSNRL